jgi:carbon monoxide dehydrogenase subunit G
MASFSKTIEVQADVANTWALVGNLEAMGRLAGAGHVEVVGMHRTCTFDNGAVQHEEISDYSVERRSYHYSIEGSPLPVRNNRGRFGVVPAGERSAIIWDAEFEVLDPAQEEAVFQMWEGAMSQVMGQMKRMIEGGEG